jgi:hypothetical protein
MEGWGEVITGVASGLGSSSGPTMASGGAYGAPTDVSVGGLTVNKTKWPELAGALVLGLAIAWLIKK